MNNHRSQTTIDRWSNINNLAFTILFMLYFIIPVEKIWFVVTGLLSFLVLWMIHIPALKYFRPFGGYANWITLFRLLLVIFVVLKISILADTTIFLLILTAVLLDGLDGYVARRTNQVSTFGTHFDMESDAFYVALMSMVLYEQALFGYWLLVIGFLRYLYGSLLYILRWHTLAPLRMRWGPLIAGIFFMALPTPFLLPEKIYCPVVVISSGLIVLSFMVSFVFIILEAYTKSKR